MALAMQGEFKEALAAFRRAGDEQSARANLGFARFERGEYAQAIEEYERALVAGGPADVQVVRNLKAARSALVASGNRPAPDGREVAEDDGATEVDPADGAEVADTNPTSGEEVADTKPVDPTSGAGVEPTPGRRADDPWLWEAAPPGAAAE
jgi:tetratricopeptide (TPR) repeat protein